MSQDQLADAILAIRTPSAAPAGADTIVPKEELDARSALAGLRDAIEAGIIRNDEPHRVILSDGSIVERQAAIEWRALMTAISELGDSVLGKATPWRAYPGASWPDEPVEADHVGSFATLEEAMAECAGYRKGGFDDFVIHETTREVWRRKTGSDEVWRRQPSR